MTAPPDRHEVGSTPGAVTLTIRYRGGAVTIPVWGILTIHDDRPSVVDVEISDDAADLILRRTIVDPENWTTG